MNHSKQRNTMSTALQAALGAALIAASLPAMAQAWQPDKNIEIIINTAPGSGQDSTGRLVQSILQDRKLAGTASITINNKPGGGGVVGGVEVASARADGYTIGSFTVGIPTVKTMGADAQIAPDALEPVGIFLTYPFLIAAKGDAPYSNMAELAEHSKSNEVRLGHFGYGIEPTMMTFRSFRARCRCGRVRIIR